MSANKTPLNTPQESSLVTPAWLALSSPDGPADDRFCNLRMAAKSRQNEIQKRTEKLFVVQQQITEAIRGRKSADEVRSLIERSNVILRLPKGAVRPRSPSVAGPEAPDEEAPHPVLKKTISYRQQGNIEMYTNSNMKQREQNRHHPLVVEALDNFWEVLPKTMFGNINKSIYAWYTRKLYFSFTPAATEEEFRRILDEDWKNDAVWSCSMNVRMFRVAMYNLADIWCETTEPKEYHDFLVRCMSIVQSGGPYTGTTREGDSTDTSERAMAGAFSRRRTTIAPDIMVEFSDAEIARGAEDIDDSQVDAEQALEQIELEMFTCDHTGAYSIISNVGAMARQEVQDMEEDVLHELQVLRERKSDVLELVSGDMPATLEELLLDEMQEESARRDKREDRMKDCVAQLKKVAKESSSDISKRIKIRMSASDHHAKTQLEILNKIRERTMESFLAARQFKNSVMDLQRDVVNHSISQVGERDDDLMVFLGMHLQDLVRRNGCVGELAEDLFNQILFVAKDVQDQRQLRLNRLRDPLGSEVFPMSAGRDHENIKFDSPKWSKTIEWFVRHRRARNDYLEDALRSIDELQSRLQFRGKQQLQAIHRQQMNFETKYFELIGNDNTIPHAIKMSLLKDFEEEKKTSQARRSKETMQYNTINTQWRETIAAVLAQASERLDAEEREIKAWASAKTTRQAFDGSKQLLDVLAMEAPCGMSEESVIRNRLMTELPEAVSGPLAFVCFSVAQYDQWFQQAAASLTNLRLNLFNDNHSFMFRMEADEMIRQLEIGLRALQQRMSDTDRYKRAAKEPAADNGRRLTDSSEQKIATRLDMTQEVRSTASGMQESIQVFKAEMERVILLMESRHRQRLSCLQKLEMESAFYMGRFTELEGLRFCHYANRYCSAVDALAQPAEGRQATVAGLDPAFLERRRREDERLQQLREKRQAEARELEAQRLQRLLEAEAEMKALMLQKERRQQDQAQLRKKQLIAREQATQERIQREMVERRMWQEEIASEKKRVAQQRPSDAGATPEPTLKPATAQPGLVRRKSKAVSYNPSVDAEKAKQCKTRVGAKNRVLDAIAQEIDMFKQLNTQSLAINLNEFEGRRMEYLLDGLSNHGIYLSECKRLKLEPRAAVEAQLPKKAFSFNIPFLDFSNFLGLATQPILDVIRMNPVQKLSFKGTGLEKDELRKVCQAILNHPFMHVLDVSLNKELGPHGGQSLLTLVKENRLISTVVCDNCGIPEADVAAIAQVCQNNAFVRAFSRADFDFLKAIFQSMDVDRSGVVTTAELEAYIAAQSPKCGKAKTRKEAPASPTRALRDSQSLTDRKDKILDVLFELKRQERGGFGLAEFLSFIFPTLTRGDCDEIVKKYDENSQTDFAEAEDFLVTYGQNGRMSLEALAKGLGETDIEALRAAFQECDVDNDGFLDAQEFLMFISG
jgi:Ca2+-binding EF-hand superfamily protein